MYRPYNPNPGKRRTGDCTVRAIAKATGQSWLRVYCWLCVHGALIYDMPNYNAAWGRYLWECGFRRSIIPDDCPDCYDYTVEDFCQDHPRGTYVLGTGTHVVCVINGDYYDSWDSGSEVVTFFYYQKEV